MKINAKQEEKVKFTFTKTDFTQAVREQVEAGGQKIESMTWNEQNTKLEVEAVKLKK